MNRVQITERHSYHDNKGIARFFVPYDPTCYGYWVGEDLWDAIVGKDIAKKMRDRTNQDTIEIELPDDKVDLIRQKGNNPYASGKI
jgi:hypothetical protein